MKAGSPPANPAEYCRHREGRAAPTSEALDAAWLPEGNGAALYEREELLAIIPPWSGHDGFDGYARENIGQGPVAWELTDDNVLAQRFADASDYWKAWDDEDLWPRFQTEALTDIETQLGPHSNYYAIDGGQWPPKAMLRIPVDGGIAFVTIGMSLRPQPNVEMSSEFPGELRRVELGAVLPADWGEDSLNRFAQYLSGQSGLPWERYTWLGPGHTLPCDSWGHPAYDFSLMAYQHPAVPKVDLPTAFGDPVNVLWMIALTSDEVEAARANGSESVAKQLPQDRWLMRQ